MHEAKGIMKEAMQVTLALPEDLAGLLGSSPDGLSRVALEALALEETERDAATALRYRS